MAGFWMISFHDVGLRLAVVELLSYSADEKNEMYPYNFR